jgi:hypothetical protein
MSALQLVMRALDLAEHSGETIWLAVGLEALAVVIAPSRPQEVVRAAAAAGAIREKLGAPGHELRREPLRRAIDAARESLDGDLYAQVWTEASRESPHESIDLIRRSLVGYAEGQNSATQ